MMGILTWPWMHLLKELKNHLLNITLKLRLFKELFALFTPPYHPEGTFTTRNHAAGIPACQFRGRQKTRRLKQISPENHKKICPALFQPACRPDIGITNRCSPEYRLYVFDVSRFFINNMNLIFLPDPCNLIFYSAFRYSTDDKRHHSLLGIRR